MNNTDENICRLCLKTICSNDFDIIEDVTVQMFDGLLLKIELNKNEENVMCSKCATDLQKSFDFKLACINLKSKDLPSAKGNPTLNTANTCSVGTRNDPFDDRKACRFCANLTEAHSFTCLNETKENMLIVDMLQQHMPELELDISEELVSCEVCFKSLHHLLRFTSACSSVKQKVEQYSTIEVIDDKNKIKLELVEPLAPADNIDSNATNVHSIKEVFEIKIEEDFAVKTEMNDENMETNNLDASTEAEEICVKSEQSNNDSCQITTGFDTKTFQKCSWCSSEADNLSKLRTHFVTHQSTSDQITNKSEHCSFETKQESHLQEHTLTHKTSSQVTLLKSDTCVFETEFKAVIRGDMVEQKERSQAKIYSCQICSREFKHKYSATRHMLLHQNPSDIKMYKCEMCTYETRYKVYFKRHMLVHTFPSEAMYGDDYDPLELTSKNVVDTQALRDKKSTEMIIKCNHCSFKTKQINHAQDHTNMHQTNLEIKMFKCDTCAFETKYKSAIKRHMMTHKSPSQTKMYSCPICTREFKYKHNVVDHMLLHQNPSDITKYKCELCKYETRHKSCVKRHMQTHGSENSVYRCEYCRFKSKYEHGLNAHKMSHFDRNGGAQVLPSRQKYAMRTY